MKLVVDANILFSALIKEGMTKKILFDLSYELYSPAFIFEEFKKHQNEILFKTHRTNEEFYKILESLKEIISFVPDEDFTDYIEGAEKICPDYDDSAYFALALKLNCPIWSGEKSFKEQSKIKVFNTKELVEEFFK